MYPECCPLQPPCRCSRRVSSSARWALRKASRRVSAPRSSRVSQCLWQAAQDPAFHTWLRRRFLERRLPHGWHRLSRHTHPWSRWEPWFSWWPRQARRWAHTRLRGWTPSRRSGRPRFSGNRPKRPEEPWCRHWCPRWQLRYSLNRRPSRNPWSRSPWHRPCHKYHITHLTNQESHYCIHRDTALCPWTLKLQNALSHIHLWAISWVRCIPWKRHCPLCRHWISHANLQ